MTALARRHTSLALAIAAAIACVGLSSHAVVAAQHAGMTGRKPGGMGMSQDAGAMTDMSVIHELVINHDRITRTVTNLPDGIRTVTESTDPQLAQRIKEHVANMDQRVTAGEDPNLPPESPALHAIFANHDKIKTTIETTATGVVVVQTSSDPGTVAVLQQHAAEVSDLVKGGMTAMHAAMMKQSRGTMGPGMTHEQHLAQMKKDADLKEHGDMAMGFDQDKATHHFTLTADGGAIAVTTNDPADLTTRDQIRTHLAEIAQAFANADFRKPVMTHGESPDGAPDMQRFTDRIVYRFEQTERGGAVRIITSDPQALNAVHEFLRYQIREHSTGDPLSVQK